jgi:hypothetical protein
MSSVEVYVHQEPTMSIDSHSTQILLSERFADLRHEADQERLVRGVRLAHPRRPTGFRPWWRRLVRQQLGTPGQRVELGGDGLPFAPIN